MDAMITQQTPPGRNAPAPDTTQAPAPPTHQADPTPLDPSPVDRQALIYATLLRQYLTSGDAGFGDYRFPRSFLLNHAVAGGGDPGWGASGVGLIPPAVQRTVTRALADLEPLTFVASADAAIADRGGCAHFRDQGILIALGPVDGVGDRVEVGVKGFVACLGASSLTYLVERASSGWLVSNITARGPVA